jgi:hypothetical protein
MSVILILTTGMCNQILVKSTSLNFIRIHSQVLKLSHYRQVDGAIVICSVALQTCPRSGHSVISIRNGTQNNIVPNNIVHFAGLSVELIINNARNEQYKMKETTTTTT